MKGDAPDPGESRRVEELLRVNAELAAEIRSLSLGRTGKPRSARVPAARRADRIANLTAERDEVAARLAAAEDRLAHVERDNSQLRDLVEDQRRQIERLRSGFSGWIRRIRMRILGG